MGQGSYKRLKEMAERWDISMADMIRRALDAYYEQWEKRKYGFTGVELARRSITKAQKKASRDSAIAELRGMDAPALEQRLTEMGYFAFYTPPKNAIDAIESLSSGLMWVQYIRGTEGQTISRREIFTVDEIIGDLKKNKFI